MQKPARRIALVVPACLSVILFPVVLGASAGAEAREILGATGVKGGLVVHVGCGDGRLTAALRANDSYLVHGLDRDAANVRRAREHIRSLGLYGKVAVDRLDGRRLPYVANLVNLLVVEDAGGAGEAELMRVLCPNGVACVRKDGKWAKAVKPRPREIDEWTHYMHDAGGNAVAHDSVVGPPRRYQWVGSPRWSRHHDHMSSVSAVVAAGGRVFYVLDEGSRASILLPPRWHLIARDAFSGTILWKRPMGRWHTHVWRLKSGPAKLPRRLVAVGDEVYATLALDAPLTAFDAATGKTLRTYKDTKATEEVIASEGVLFLSVDRSPTEVPPPTPRPRGAKPPRRGRSFNWGPGDRHVLAVASETGEVLWRKQTRLSPLTLSADAEGVYFHDGEKVVRLDRGSGKEVWASAPLPVRAPMPSYFAPTLIVHQDVVLYAGGEKLIPHRGGRDMMTALSAGTGKTLWTAEHPPSGYQSPEDTFVVGGLVWTGSTTSGGYDGVFTGRDLHTGEVKVQFAPDVKTYWFHHRCHRGKATDKYLLTSRTGIEFIDVRRKQWLIHHWVRGACLYGIMPCNGLIYAPPHPCACYPEAKLNGFSVVAPKGAGPRIPKDAAQAARLERGPAYGKVNPQSAIRNPQSEDWPTYRHDALRSGHSRTAVPADLKRAWQADLGGRLSSAVIAGGKVFVAQVDAHAVHALDAASGKRLWSYTAGGRVDSPPTIHRGRVLFGSADGWVYCLRAADGELIWRFRAAPMDERMTAWEQVESVWPVHGSVLVRQDELWCVAGRSMFLDGGLRLLRLEPGTGELLSETVMDDRDPNTGRSIQERIAVLNMPVALPDILSGDGRFVYMKSQVFDGKGKRLDLGPHSGDPARQGSVQRGETAHVFCPSGFLDDSWWHRTYWVYGRSFAGGHAGYYQAGKFAPSGRILTFDDANVYAFGRQPQYYRWTAPLEHHLFAASREAPGADDLAPKAAARRGAAGSMIRFENTASLNPAGKPVAVEAWVRPAKKAVGVILARGGPSHGYALVLKAGRAQFAVRVKEQVFAVTAKKRVAGEWIHLVGALTADKKLLIYVNGKQVASGEAGGLIAEDPKQPMEIGADDAGAVGDYNSPFAFTGLIDEVRVYHGTLTAGEIEKHYSTAGDTAARDAKLVLCCSFDKGGAADESGNKNHGKLGDVQAVKGKVGGAMKFTGRAGSARGGGSRVKFHWSQKLPLMARAMVLADRTLFIAGPPDVVDEDEAHRQFRDPEVQAKLAEQAAAMKGRKGALLWAVSTADGRKLAARKLDTLPIFDGLAAAGGRLYLVTADGKVICLAGR